MPEGNGSEKKEFTELEERVEYFRLHKDYDGLQKALGELAEAHFRAGNLRRASEVLDEQCDVFFDLHDPKGLARAISRRADVETERIKKELEEAGFSALPAMRSRRTRA